MIGKSSYKKIDTKIYIVFIAVIAIAFFNAIFSSYTIRQSQKTTEEIVDNTVPSKDALSQLNMLVIKSQMLITNWVYFPSNTSDKQKLQEINNSEYPAVKDNLVKLMQHWEDKKLVNDVDVLLNEFEKVSQHQKEIMERLSSFDNYQDAMSMFIAEDILESQIIPLSHSIESKLQTIIRHQSMQAKSSQDAMLSQLNTLMAVVFSIAILIVGSLFFAAFVISRSFIVPVLRVREIINEMNLGRLPEYRMKVPKNAVGEMLVALKSLIESVKRTVRFAEEIGKGNLDAEFTPMSEDDIHGHALVQMRNSLKAANQAESERNWINDGVVRLNNIMRSNANDFNQLLNNIISMVVEYTNVQQAAIFLLHNDDMEEMHIQLGAYYALNSKILNSKRYELKEGLIGEAIASNKIIDLENIDDPFFTIDMGIASVNRYSLMILPLSTSGKVVGAISVASLSPLTQIQKAILYKITEPVAASLFSVRANLVTTQLLDESRKQAEELALQEQELRTINARLTQKSQELAVSEDELKLQQQELQQVNLQLQEKAKLLEEKNIAVEQAHQSLEFKAEQLEQSNKYKSAFLANMSHELRTPLNSILILAKILASNKNNTLTEKQIEHINVIYKSGSDLLMLINDILDLSKIEAGKVELQKEIFDVGSLGDDMQMLFGEFASDKKIVFKTEFHIDRLSQINNDKMRILQVMKNLLSNAFKFTPAGGTVTLTFKKAEDDARYRNASLHAEKHVIAIEVSDTGIGIPKEKQAVIFEAFQQADGSTSRKYGGTGLGLSICRELSQLINGEMQLKSDPGTGSTFTLYIPAESLDKSELNEMPDLLSDDKKSLLPGDKRILIIEDDSMYAKMLVHHCHMNGLKAIVALRGDTGLQYASTFRPDAIILDIHLPGIDGLTLLKRIKSDNTLKHIPVHVLTSDENTGSCIELGATSFNRKSNNDLACILQGIGKDVISGKSHLLIIDSNKYSEEFSDTFECHYASADECSELLHASSGYSCIIANKTTKAEIKDRLQAESENLNIPLLYFMESPDECLRELKNTTPEDSSVPGIQTKLFIDAVKSSGDKGSMSGKLRGKVALVADDDVRNIYSITSSLEAEGMHVICAMNGREAIEVLKQNPQTDIVLMDIMMPDMNGCDAISEIRKNKSFSSIPVIAVTALAMQDDRQKCLDAGANDYISKPVNIESLISVMVSLVC